MIIDHSLFNRKADLIDYFSDRSSEATSDLFDTYGSKNFKKIAQKIPVAIKETRDNLLRVVKEKSLRERWGIEETYKSRLLINHVANVLMLRSRHEVWPYEYMAFSRRVGELWESFMSVCFHESFSSDLEFVIPPLFSDVRKELHSEVVSFIEKLNLNYEEKQNLLSYYNKVWLLVDAGEIKLELDMHFKKEEIFYNIDFKSGFSSNEKGNTNRLLVVASIFLNIIENEYRNLLIVRTPEEGNNHYLQTLKKSTLWDVYCGDQAYEKIGQLINFNINGWISENINWPSDLGHEMFNDLKRDNLSKYLEW